jgi:RNA polymerase sigma-70 factor (ECF subfamily)
MPGSASCEFQDRLTAFLPNMRVWAMGLTRNRAAAEDLVQDVAMKALAASESFVPGTNFSAWGAPYNDQSLHFRRAKPARVQ